VQFNHNSVSGYLPVPHKKRKLTSSVKNVFLLNNPFSSPNRVIPTGQSWLKKMSTFSVSLSLPSSTLEPAADPGLGVNWDNR
jgi:hypothetical protein